MIENIWKKDKTFIAFTGFLAAIAGLFLNIAIPQNPDAMSALANIQVFWLIILLVCLCKLFFSFFKELLALDWKHKTFGIFSISTGYIFVWIILNLAQYIVNFNNQYTSFLIEISVLFGAVGLLVWFLIIVDKYDEKFSMLSKGVIWSFYMSAVVVLIGTIIEIQKIKFISYFWFYKVLPISFAAFLIIFIGICVCRKIKLSQP